MTGKRIDYTLAVTLLAAGHTFDEAAEQCGAKNGATLKRGCIRKGITKEGIRRRVTRQVTMQVTTAQSEMLRSGFADILQKGVDALGEMPVRRNLKHIKQFADAVEPLARTAKVVHGWGDAPTVSIVSTEADPQDNPDLRLDTQPVVPVEDSSPPQVANGS